MNKKQIENEKLRLMVFESAKELGEKVDKHLLDRYGIDSNKYTFIVPIRENFFSDGHLKVEIDETVRGKNLFLLTDIGNYSITYKMHELINHASPNDLMAQLKDGIGASNCHAANINIIMPLLYAGRQHRRNTRENLMCGMALREIDSINRIKSLITFDVHDQGVEHAIHNMEFDNFYATNTILEQFIDDLTIDELRNLVFVAPDNGATGRRNVYLNSFSSDYINKEAGSFYKERNYNTLVNGKYPVVKHEYSGNQNLEGKTAIIIDDMISSGGSMFDVINSLKERNISHIYIITTFALFTNGIDKFDEYYNNNMFDGLYTTNLSYIPKFYQEKSWLHICDCSKMMSEIVYNLHNDLSISGLLKDKSGPIKILEKKFNNNKKD